MDEQIDRSALFNFGMEKLHQEIKLDVFSRLPVESVLICKLVCKTWRNLIRLPCFADIHLHHQLQRLEYRNHSHDSPTPAAGGDNVGFLILNMRKSSPIFYLEYDENEKSYKKVKRINHPPLKRSCYSGNLVGSCNGLVCFSIPFQHDICDPVYICNPITNEYINLPKFDILQDYMGVYINQNSRMVSGFGYSPSTNEYKVVRIIYYDISGYSYTTPNIGHVQVYTLGDGNGWRKKGEITYKLFRSTSLLTAFPGILANGALHWVECEDWKIVAFDMETEEFSLLPSLPCVQPDESNYFQLRVLGGYLCVIQQDTDSNEGLNIWSFKERNCEWESMLCIPYAINQLLKHINWPIALTTGGEVLMLLPYNKNALRYDLKTATLEKLEGVEDLGIDFPLSEAIPHMSSFVSLRGLGENTQRIR